MPKLIAVISDLQTSDLVRSNAALAISIIYPSQPEAIHVLVEAARAESNPIAANRSMDQAGAIASRCLYAEKNDCENAVLR